MSYDPFDDGHLSQAERQAAEDERIADSWRRMSGDDVRRKLWALNGHPLRLMLGRILAVACERFCPEHLELLPKDFRELPAANDNRTGGGTAA